MKRFQVEFSVAGEDDSWTVEANDAEEAGRVVEYEYAYDHVTIHSVSPLGDCA